MLVTTCKHCGARFRVTPEQLNLRQGQVRCGQCHDVFNGFESLERFPGDDTGARLLAARAAKPAAHAALEDLGEADLGQRMRTDEIDDSRNELSIRLRDNFASTNVGDSRNGWSEPLHNMITLMKR